MAVHGVGGGGATEHENGDTALPAHVYSEHDYQVALNPFDRVRVNGTLFRIETHDGEMVYVSEGVEAKCYGVPRENLYAIERKPQPHQCHVYRGEVMRARMDLLVAFVRLHPGEDKHAMHRTLGYPVRTVEHYLYLLTSEGTLRQVYGAQANRGRAPSTYFEAA